MYNDYFPAMDASCSSSGHCGMHVNISNGLFGKTPETQAEAIRKLYYLINVHFNFACALFLRPLSHTGYCGPECLTKEDARQLDLTVFGSDHHTAVNLGHYTHGRIELRIVGGQPNFGGFRNTMETVFHLVQRAQRIKWADIDNMIEWFKGCNQYVYDRLSTKCREYLNAETLKTIKTTVKHEELI